MMGDNDHLPVSDNPRKRAAPEESSPEKKPLNLKGTQFAMPTPPTTDDSSNTSPTCSTETAQREASPAESISTLSSMDITGSNTIAGTAATALGSTQPPKKRRKLTPTEKLAEQQEKGSKARDRAEQKAQRDEEKRVKDEEKQRKAGEREAKKREKDIEEQRKQDEKLKKEQKQMRLGAFFPPSATPAKPLAPRAAAENSPFARRKSLSLEPYDAIADLIRKSQSPAKRTPQAQSAVKEETPAPAPPPQPTATDYQKYFLPFELPSNSTLAPLYSLSDHDDLAYLQGIFDAEVQKDSLYDDHEDLGLAKPAVSVGLSRIFGTDSSSRQGVPRGIRIPAVREIAERAQGTSQRPIDLTDDFHAQFDPNFALKPVSYRHIQFDEDVRPPYLGTFTKIRSPRVSSKVRRNPFTRARVDTDYDYDSEQEWEEPEEGEELLDDEEEEAESQGDADEMVAFLDDEDDLRQKRKAVTNDLQPVSTGLCWEDEAGEIVVESIETAEEPKTAKKPMRGMRIGVLLPGFTGQTIDPFSTAYWTNDMAPPGLPVADTPRFLTTPSRPPLQERTNSNGTLAAHDLLGAAEGEKGPITSVAATQGAKPGPKPQAKTLSKEDLEEFKEAVVNSPLGKLDLCKGLKSRYVLIPFLSDRL